MHFRTRTIHHLNRLCIVLVRHAQPDFYCACSQKQKTAGRHATSLEQIILTWSQPIVITLSSKLQCAWQRSSDYQFYSLCCYCAGDITYYLPHLGPNLYVNVLFIQSYLVYLSFIIYPVNKLINHK